jgi:opacity protein-like surface antigen
MKRTIAVAALLAALALTSCNVDSNDAYRLLTQEGVNSVKLTGYAFFGCSKGDDFSTKFTGVKNGVPVKGTICGGVFKNYTIRYE